MKLLSWLDVQRRIRHECPFQNWPQPIVQIRCYWDVIEVLISKDGDRSVAKQIFQKWFTSRYEATEQEDEGKIYLEIKDKTLPVRFEQTDEEPDGLKTTISPSWEALTFIPDFRIPNENRNTMLSHLPQAWKAGPAIVVFHSSKGGVGRTTHLIACLRAAMDELSGKKPCNVLVVDADVEAPGLSIWEEREQVPRVSFIDFLELVHYDRSPNATESLDFIVKELRKNRHQDGKNYWYVLPANRTEEQLLHWPVKPEYMIQGDRGPYILSESLHSLGKKLDVQLVLVDLRSGLNELGGALLLDPRLQRVIVSSLNPPSIAGSRLLLRQMAKLASLDEPLKNKQASDPTVLLTMVLDQMKKEELSHAEEDLLNEYPDPALDDTTPPRITILQTDFAEELMHLDSYANAFEKLRGTSVQKTMREFVQQFSIPDPAFRSATGKRSPELIKQTEQLKELCQRFEFAESGTGDDILITASLRKLALDHSEEIPNVVVMGPKGAGKTFTFLQLARLQSWEQFFKKTEGKSSHDGEQMLLTMNTTPDSFLLFPLLEPIDHMEEKAKQITAKARANVWTHLKIENTTNWNIRDVVDDIRENSSDQNTKVPNWQNYWLNLMARSIGLQSENTIKAQDIHTYLRKRGQKVIFLFDGLETTFQNINKSSIEQTALRELLHLPGIFREIPDSFAGMVLLIRRDLAANAIPQNFAQFRSLYAVYELFWEFPEALHLVAWLCFHAKVFPDLSLENILAMPLKELENLLHKVWGLRLGPDNSKEARTSIWVHGALSDFRGTLQARDLVRLIHYAAKEESDRNDRLLAPVALKSALEPCGKEKIEEIKQEYPVMESITEKLKTASRNGTRIPFELKDIDLNSAEIAQLTDIGVIMETREKKVYMPEIYRLGFGFELESRARPKVVSLKKQFLRRYEKELR